MSNFSLPLQNGIVGDHPQQPGAGGEPSISENVKWGKRKSFADGNVCVPFTHLLGYERGADGNLAINDEEAEIVRLIYKLFMSGHSYQAIANELTKRQIKTPGGKDSWCPTTVKSIT